MKRWIAAAVLFAAWGAHANNFRVADTVYLPTAGKVSVFNTDIYLSNPNDERVSVSVAFAPTETANNAGAIASARTLAMLQPRERREITDPMALFGLAGGLGQLIFFGCREGASDCDCVTDPGDCRGISVEARIYATSTSCANGAASCTTGQLFSGLPWYSYAGRNSASGYDKVFVAGIRQSGSRGVSGYRSNVGLINASQFSTAELTVTLFRADGAQIGSAAVTTLGPLGHTQRNIAQLVPEAATLDGTAYFVVEQTGATPTADAAENGCADGCPGFFAYGSVLDNVTDDPTTMEAQFFGSLSDAQLGCVFSEEAPARPVRRK